ncbi:tetratricopeptide repeat protein [Flavobacterium jejuense]|uniref:histidine kinase n=1 Tax=Flavobacterium jejuense TaxID=1544455 RepID=A0ABX0IS21_9FLAO|nr:tetratricopeptide repeat-containing sensor histidine kinase [Flavobacterium jejuense]NHN26645.1 tetratricopeptide repeat protein [Flavobacterium jejuense]
MSNYISKFFIFSTFIFFLSNANGQEVKNKNITLNQENLAILEKTRTDATFDLLNNNEEEKAYAEAKRLIKLLKTKESNVRLNIILSYYFNKKTQLDSMSFYANKALKNTEAIANDSLRRILASSSYNLLALSNNKRGLFEASKKYHLKGIEIVEKQKKGYPYYVNLHGLANIYMKLGDFTNAIKYFKQCLDYKEDSEITIGSHVNLGAIYGFKKEYESSNYYLKKINSLCKEQNNFQCQSLSALNMGENYEDIGKHKEALEYYEESLEIAKKSELYGIESITNQNIGRILYLQKRYEESKLYFLNALHIALAYNLLNQQKEIYLKLKEIAVYQNDYQSAYALMTRYSEVKDSIAKMQNDQDINELDIKFKTLQKENEIKDLTFKNNNKVLLLKNQEKTIENLNLQKAIEKKQNENELLKLKEITQKKVTQINLLKKDKQIKESEILREKQVRNIVIIGFLVLLIPIIALSFVYYQKQKAQILINKKQKEISEQKNKAILKDQELKLVKAEIEGQDKERIRIAQELHDSVGGNLAAIKLQLTNSSYGKENEIKRINSQINETYNQIRSISHNLLPKRFNLNNFCEFVEEYQNKVAKSSNIKAYLSAHPREKINNIDEKILSETYHIIQELITNTIKHAHATNIELQLNLIENLFSVIFEDNGKGFTIENNKDGIGLTNIKNRINNLNGSLHIDSTPNRGAIFNIEIPIL